MGNVFCGEAALPKTGVGTGWALRSHPTKPFCNSLHAMHLDGEPPVSPSPQQLSLGIRMCLYTKNMVLHLYRPHDMIHPCSLTYIVTCTSVGWEQSTAAPGLQHCLLAQIQPVLNGTRQAEAASTSPVLRELSQA